MTLIKDKVTVLLVIVIGRIPMRVSVPYGSIGINSLVLLVS